MRRLLALGLALAWAPAVLAHEVQYEVVRGSALAMKVYFADGEPLMYTEYEVYSPQDSGIPYQKGRTDRRGYLSFVPDTPGQWRVRVIDQSGHGLDVRVESASAWPAREPARGRAWLRPLGGLLAIAAIFLVLYLLSRKGRPR